MEDLIVRIAEDIQNYYEHMVVEYIVDHWDQLHLDELEELMPDVMCVALNHLPPRYIRFEIDMAFYLSAEERLEMDHKVEKAVKQAIATVKRHRRDDSNEDKDEVLEVTRRPAITHFNDEGEELTLEDTPGKLSVAETVAKLREELAKKGLGS